MSEKDVPIWISSLVGYPARNENGEVVGILWSILTLAEHIERLPDNLRQVANEMISASSSEVSDDRLVQPQSLGRE